jgi:hypothetical protein
VSRLPIAAALALSVGLALAAACQPGVAPPPARSARSSPPAPPAVRLRPPAEAILSDQAVGAPRQSGEDHLTAEQAASGQQDQAAALAQYRSWAWVDAASRTWTGAGETLVLTARPDAAARAFDAWAAAAPDPCPAAAGAGLDGCRLGVTGDRAVVVGRLGPDVFRLDCPASAAERLTAAQAASLRA